MSVTPVRHRPRPRPIQSAQSKNTKVPGADRQPGKISLGAGEAGGGTTLSRQTTDATLTAISDQTGLRALVSRPMDWHAIMSQVFGYSASAKTSPDFMRSESIRGRLQAAVQSGRWADTGFRLVEMPTKSMNGRPAAFRGGDTASGDDDAILVDQALMAGKGPVAARARSAAIGQEVFHALEQIVSGGGKDTRLVGGAATPTASGEGAPLDEGRLGIAALGQYKSTGKTDLSALKADPSVARADGGTVAGQAVEYAETDEVPAQTQISAKDARAVYNGLNATEKSDATALVKAAANLGPQTDSALVPKVDPEGIGRALAALAPSTPQPALEPGQLAPLFADVAASAGDYTLSVADAAKAYTSLTGAKKKQAQAVAADALATLTETAKNGPVTAEQATAIFKEALADAGVDPEAQADVARAAAGLYAVRYNAMAATWTVTAPQLDTLSENASIEQEARTEEVNEEVRQVEDLGVRREAAKRGAAAKSSTALNQAKTNDVLKSAGQKTGLGALAASPEDWHAVMGDIFGYDPKAKSSSSFARSEALRGRVDTAIKTGDWSKTGLRVTGASAEALGGRPAAFIGGNTAARGDDMIMLDNKLLSGQGGGARADAVTQEMFHAFERHVTGGGDDIVAPGGQPLDEGRLGLLATKQFAKTGSTDLSALKKDPTVLRSDKGEVDGASAEFADNATLSSIDNFVRWGSINPKYVNRFTNGQLNAIFSGPESFAKIAATDTLSAQDWLTLNGSRSLTTGVQNYVKWRAGITSGGANTTQSAAQQAQFKKSLGDALSDGTFAKTALNRFDNASLSASGNGVAVDSEIWGLASVDTLLNLGGTRSGTRGVGWALRANRSIYGAAQSDAGLQAMLGTEGKTHDFMKRFTPDQLDAKDPNLLNGWAPAARGNGDLDTLLNGMTPKGLVRSHGKNNAKRPSNESLFAQDAASLHFATREPEALIPYAVELYAFAGQGKTGRSGDNKSIQDFIQNFVKTDEAGSKLGAAMRLYENSAEGQAAGVNFGALPGTRTTTTPQDNTNNGGNNDRSIASMLAAGDKRLGEPDVSQAKPAGGGETVAVPKSVSNAADAAPLDPFAGGKTEIVVKVDDYAKNGGIPAALKAALPKLSDDKLKEVMQNSYVVSKLVDGADLVVSKSGLLSFDTNIAKGRTGTMTAAQLPKFVTSLLTTKVEHEARLKVRADMKAAIQNPAVQKHLEDLAKAGGEGNDTGAASRTGRTLSDAASGPAAGPEEAESRTEYARQPFAVTLWGAKLELKAGVLEFGFVANAGPVHGATILEGGKKHSRFLLNFRLTPLKINLAKKLSELVPSINTPFFNRVRDMVGALPDPQLHLDGGFVVDVPYAHGELPGDVARTFLNYDYTKLKFRGGYYNPRLELAGGTEGTSVQPNLAKQILYTIPFDVAVASGVKYHQTVKDNEKIAKARAELQAAALTPDQRVEARTVLDAQGKVKRPLAQAAWQGLMTSKNALLSFGLAKGFAEAGKKLGAEGTNSVRASFLNPNGLWADPLRLGGTYIQEPHMPVSQYLPQGGFDAGSASIGVVPVTEWDFGQAVGGGDIKLRLQLETTTFTGANVIQRKTLSDGEWAVDSTAGRIFINSDTGELTGVSIDYKGDIIRGVQATNNTAIKPVILKVAPINATASTSATGSGQQVNLTDTEQNRAVRLRDAAISALVKAFNEDVNLTTEDVNEIFGLVAEQQVPEQFAAGPSNGPQPTAGANIVAAAQEAYNAFVEENYPALANAQGGEALAQPQLPGNDEGPLLLPELPEEIFYDAADVEPGFLGGQAADEAGLNVDVINELIANTYEGLGNAPLNALNIGAELAQQFNQMVGATLQDAGAAMTALWNAFIPAAPNQPVNQQLAEGLEAVAADVADEVDTPTSEYVLAVEAAAEDYAEANPSVELPAEVLEIVALANLQRPGAGSGASI